VAPETRAIIAVHWEGATMCRGQHARDADGERTRL